jgi:7-carboxy-7-deazaguanine synthase
MAAMTYNNRMRIAELFYSIQGEGKLTGLPSLFIRVSGCNLRCTWCDTPYASWKPEGEEMAVSEIVAQAQRLAASSGLRVQCAARGLEYRARGSASDAESPPNHERRIMCPPVVLTGGEPMIMPDIDELCAAFKEAGHHLTIETAATIFKPLPLDLASLSPKLANSTPWQRESGRFAQAHERQRLNIPVIQQFIDHSPDFQLKFVVAEPADMEEIDSILNQLRGWSRADVLLMPEGTDPGALAARAPWLAEVCKQTGFRYCPRLHVELYGNTRGT